LFDLEPVYVPYCDYYYYTDVTPLKAKNMLLHHETLKFNCSNCNNVTQLKLGY